jgi:hypothetical protein
VTREKIVDILIYMNLKKRIARSVAGSIGLATAFTSYLLSATPAAAQTRTWSGVCVGPTEGASDVATIQGLECLIANIFTVVITLIGLAGFVMFVVGGIMWMLSGTDTQATANARKTMTYAVIGLVVTLSSFILLNLISAFTGINIITQFRIPTDS